MANKATPIIARSKAPDLYNRRYELQQQSADGRWTTIMAADDAGSVTRHGDYLLACNPNNQYRVIDNEA